MELKDYYTKNEAGEYVFDEAKFKADIDRERNSASKTSAENTEKRLRDKLEAEIRTKLEEEAKLSAEEKLQKEREALLSERKSFNKERIKTLYRSGDLFGEEEAEALCGLITDDYNASLTSATALIEARKKKVEVDKQKLLQDIQAGQGNPSGQGGSTGDSDAVRRAKARNAQISNDVEVKL